MKKNVKLLIGFAVVSLFIINLFTPIERVSQELVGFAIDMLQPDETFRSGELTRDLKTDRTNSEQFAPEKNTAQMEIEEQTVQFALTKATQASSELPHSEEIT